MQTETTKTPKILARFLGIFQAFAENPVVIKELRGRMRSKAAPYLISAYLGLIGLVIGVVYLTVSSTEAAYWDPQQRQSLGKAIFGVVVLMELFMVSLIAPALTAGAITSERERQTLDLVRTTTLSSHSFIQGKLGSALAYLLLLIFTALPIQSIAFMLGGVGLTELVIATLMMIVTAVHYCSLGIFLSSFMKRTTGASVTAYIIIVLSYVFLGISFFVLSVVSISAYSSNTLVSEGLEIFVTLFLWALVCTNPLLSAIFSEMILVEDQSLFLTTSPLGTYGMTLPSPWLPFLIFFSVTSLVMILLSIRFLDRPDR